MGNDDNDVATSFAHIVLCFVAGRGVSRMQGKSYTHPGMHANFFVHGVLGFLHYQGGLHNHDFKSAYILSYKATRCLALPCLMADLYRYDHSLSAVHLVSGVIPFALALAGNEDTHISNMVIACNIVSLAYYSLQNNREWGWYTAGASVLAYFGSGLTGHKIFYPLTLALMEYCAYRVFRISISHHVETST